MNRKLVAAVLILLAVAATFIIAMKSPEQGTFPVPVKVTKTENKAPAVTSANTAVINENKVSNTTAVAKTNLAQNTNTTVAKTKTTNTQPSDTTVKTSLAAIIKSKNIKDIEDGISIFIDKSDHTLAIKYYGSTLKTYHVELGEGGLADKQEVNDNLTPEGTFYVANKTVIEPEDYYLGTRWLGVSYPSIEDAKRGLDEGIISKTTYNDIVNTISNGGMPDGDTALGGHIGIHGGSKAAFGSDWTWGCIGLANADIEDFYDYVPVGAMIVIQK